MNTNNPQLHLFQVAEIQVSYNTKISPKQQLQIKSSRNSFDAFLSFWDIPTMEYEKHFCTMYLNRVLGITRHSVGGVAGTVVDNKQILGVALKYNASAIILCHNHPSGNLRPSSSDIEITKNIKKAAQFMNIVLLDHLILTPTGYYSFGDEGMI